MGNDRAALGLVSLAYVWWGSSAIFWNELASVSPIDQLGFRVVTAFFYLAVGVRMLRPRLAAKGVDASFFDPGSMRAHLTGGHILYGVGAAMMIASNWALFLWAVSNEQAVDAALGYFLMPIFSVALGVGVLGEKLRSLQLAALILSVVGIVWTVIVVGRLPLISLGVALTFAIYGFLRKQGPWDAVSGLTFETAVVAPFLFVVLVVRGLGGTSPFGDGAPMTLMLIALTGLVTVIPLLAFGSAARRVPLSVIGLLQYMNPTLQFLVGWQVLGESVSSVRLLGFVWIWFALALVVYDEMSSKRPVDGGPSGGDQGVVSHAEGSAPEEPTMS